MVLIPRVGDLHNRLEKTFLKHEFLMLQGLMLYTLTASVHTSIQGGMPLSVYTLFKINGWVDQSLVNGLIDPISWTWRAFVRSLPSAITMHNYEGQPFRACT